LDKGQENCIVTFQAKIEIRRDNLRRILNGDNHLIFCNIFI
jgi:hypothetical protein